MWKPKSSNPTRKSSNSDWNSGNPQNIQKQLKNTWKYKSSSSSTRLTLKNLTGAIGRLEDSRRALRLAGWPAAISQRINIVLGPHRPNGSCSYWVTCSGNTLYQIGQTFITAKHFFNVFSLTEARCSSYPSLSVSPLYDHNSAQLCVSTWLAPDVLHVFQQRQQTCWQSFEPTSLHNSDVKRAQEKNR